MTRSSRRSLATRQRRYLNRLLSRVAYRDTRLAETINLLEPNQLEQHLIQQFGAAATPEYLKYARGEVLSNAYGEGSLQRSLEE